MENEKDSYFQLLKDNILFRGLSADQIKKISTVTNEIELDKDELLIQEGDIGNDFFIIKSGSVEIIKQKEQAIQLATLHKGDSIGELALLENNIRSASVKTLEPCVLLKININDLKKQLSDDAIFTLIYKNLSDQLSLHLRSTNLKTIEALEKDLMQTKIRLFMGNFIITIIILLVTFAFIIGLITKLTTAAGTGIYVTIPALLILFIVLIGLMKTSGYDKRFFGFTLIHWKSALFYTFLYTLPILVFVTGAKWLIINNVSAFHSLPLFSLGKSAVHHGANEKIVLIMGLLYVFISAPIQECIIRGGLQSPLQQFLMGKYRIVWAILLSNLIFGMIHLQFSAKFSILAFIVGLFWGWLYYRYKTLIAPIFSHALIGFFILFILGIQDLIVYHS